MFGEQVKSGAQWAAAAAVFCFTLTIRIWGLSTHFWLLGDQIRDWGIALRPFRELPLTGPPTHVGGYSIGPVYYWLMWLIRVTVARWFDNLPHGGGIGQAIVEGGADALLFVAVWRYANSFLLAVTSAVLLSTAAYDVALSAIVWTSPVASAFNKIAIALVLLRRPQRSGWWLAVATAVAWGAVQIHTGSIFVTIGTLCALLVEPLANRDWPALRRRTMVIGGVILLLQLPYLAHQFAQRWSDPAMGMVAGDVMRIVTGATSPQLGKSIAGYNGALRYIQGQPWNAPFLPLLLLGSVVVIVIKRAKDREVLTLRLLPQLAAIAGYALFLGAVEPYYYLSLMPVAVLTMLFAITPRPDRTTGRLVGVILLAIAVGIVPTRLRLAATIHKMPEYAALLKGSRTLAGRGQPLRAIVTEFPLHFTTDRTFLLDILGGRIDPASRWTAVIDQTGHVSYVEEAKER